MFTDKVKAKEHYIKDLLNDKFLFDIPDYQRAYSWNKDNLKQLIDDIMDSIGLNKENNNVFEEYEPYFIGSIVLCSKEYKDDGSGLYDVIDGQQRLTSIIILIATIRDLTKNEAYKNILSSLIYQKPNELMGIKESIRVRVRGKEAEFFKKYVLTDGGTDLVNEIDEKEISEAKQNMLNAIKTFKEVFVDENGEVLESKLDEFTKYFLQKVVVVVITKDSFTSAFRLFNVINARGLPLTNADLLKSENLRVISEDKRNIYTDMWENIEQELGKDKLEQIIGFMSTMKQNRKATATVYEEFSKKIFVSEPDYIGVNFVEHLKEIKDLYNKYINEGNIELSSKDNSIYYQNLVRIMRDFIPYDEWMVALIKFIEKFKNDEDILEFLKVLEKRIVIDWVNGNSFADRLARVYKILEVIDSSSSLEEIKKSNVFISDLERTTAYFRNSLDDIEFYSKGRMLVPKYILIRLDMEKRNGEILDYTNKIMLEHILPRNAKDAYWTTNFTVDERKNWCNKLGNLVIINGTKNTKLNNKAFAEKVEQYLSKKSDFEITKEVLALNDWKIESVAGRQESLMNRALNLWTKF